VGAERRWFSLQLDIPQARREYCRIHDDLRDWLLHFCAGKHQRVGFDRPRVVLTALWHVPGLLMGLVHERRGDDGA
jgi:hypothetical protein